jgi:hypothetical protein
VRAVDWDCGFSPRPSLFKDDLRVPADPNARNHGPAMWQDDGTARHCLQPRGCPLANPRARQSPLLQKENSTKGVRAGREYPLLALGVSLPWEFTTSLAKQAGWSTLKAFFVSCSLLQATVLLLHIVTVRSNLPRNLRVTH